MRSRICWLAEGIHLHCAVVSVLVAGIGFAFLFDERPAFPGPAAIILSATLINSFSFVVSLLVFLPLRGSLSENVRYIILNWTISALIISMALAGAFIANRILA